MKTRLSAYRGAVPFLLTILVLVAALLVVPATGALASTSQQSLAPVNSELASYLAEHASNVASRTIDGKALGAMPSLIDPSLTRGMQVGPALATALPSSYDLRTYGKVTSVKNQGSWGTCWTFGSYGSLESCLLTGQSLDFAEDNLALKSGFFAAGSTASYLYNRGGNFDMSTAYLTRWDGPVYETDDAYGDSSTPAGLTARKHVQEVLRLPARASATDNDNIKNAVMQYGAVAVTMRFDGSSSGSTYYKASTASYYYNGSSALNHAVLVVGWNDSYPATNFQLRPAGNGAFLVKNSWGTGWGQSGYFWVSYYDYVFARTSEPAVFVNADATTNYSSIYQYDRLGECNAMYYGVSTGTGWFGNVFKATSTSTVTAVGFYTVYPNTTYQVYTGSSLSAKTLQTSGTLAYMGYHTVTLPTPMSVTSGANFAVAVKVSVPYSGSTLYPIPIEYPVSNYSDQATAAAGQSFVSATGAVWYDLTTVSGFSQANVCLKAYTGSTAPTMYTLTASVGTGSGTVGKSPDQTSYTANSSVILTATPADGYTFTGWSGDATGTTNPLTVTMDGNKTIYANFTATTYTLTASVGTGSGSVAKNPDQSSYAANSSVILTATPADGYTFTGWSGDASGTTNPLTVTMNGNKSIVANFILSSTTYTLTTAVGTGSGTIGKNPDQTTFNVNDSVILTATPADGYTFTGWSGDASGNINPLTVTMNGNKSIYANFAVAGSATAVEEDNAYLAYTGTWTSSSSSSYSGGKYRYANASGSSVTVKFTGSAITYVAKTASTYGIAKITLDGVSTTADLYSPSSQSQVNVWSAASLGAGTHTLVIEWSGTRGLGSGYIIDVDRFDIVGGSLLDANTTGGNTHVEQNNALLAYSSGWVSGSSSSYSGGSYIYTTTVGATVTIKFTGSGIAYIAKTSAGSGKAELTLDGGTPFYVDLFSTSTLYKVKVWSTSGLGGGTHTLVIKCSGTTSSGTGYTINLDALDITGGTVVSG